MLRRALCLVLLTILAGCGGLTPRNTSAGIVPAQVSLSTGGHQQFIFV